MIIPDRISPIIAYRTWQWDALGMLSLNNVRWTPGEALQASCEVHPVVYVPNQFPVSEEVLKALELDKPKRRRHVAPEDGCTCGVYAAKNLKHLHNIGYIGAGQICGEVYLWGKVWDHHLGYRAQYAYPKNLSICVRSIPFQINDALKHIEPLLLYNVDISLTEREYEGVKQKQYLLYRKDEGMQREGLHFLVDQRRKWYTGVGEGMQPLEVGDRVAIRDRGLGIVTRITDENDVSILMYNNVQHTMKAREIKWVRMNNRWETETVGSTTTVKRKVGL